MKHFLIFLITVLPLFADDQFKIVVEGKAIPLTFDPRRQVWVIEGAALRTLPASSLPMLISMVAHVPFVNRSLFQADPQTGGFHQEQFLVMIDGIPVNNAQTGHHNFLLPISGDQIERIEILRGPALSTPGFAGAAGAVNIVPARRNGFRLSLGNHRTLDTSLQWGWKGLHLASGYLSTDGFQPGLDGRKAFLHTSLHLPLKRGQLEFWGGWTQADYGAKYFYSDYDSFERTGKFLGSARWQSNLSAMASLNLTLATQYTTDRYTLIRDRPGLYENLHHTWQHSFDLMLRRMSLPLSYRLGMQIWADSIASTGIRSDQPATALGFHHRAFYSLFAESGWEKDRGFISGSLRVIGGGTAQFDAHMLAGLHLNQIWQAEFSVYRGTRFPTYTELYYTDPSHRANPDLAPELTHGIRTGVTAKQPKSETSGHLFVNRITDMIDWIGDDGNRIWASANIRTGYFSGFDLHHSRIAGNTRITLMFTRQWANLAEDLRIKPLKYHYYLPDHLASLHVSGLFFRFHLDGSLRLEREQATKKWRPFLNGGITREIGRFSIFLEMINIANTSLEKIPGIPESPRSIQAGFRFLSK